MDHPGKLATPNTSHNGGTRSRPLVESATGDHAAATYRQEALAAQRSHRGNHVAQVESPLQRLQALADASPQVAQLMRLQTLADSAGAEVLQRKSPDEEELLQGKFATSPAAPNRTGMPDGLKSGIEALSGLTMDHVRVHYNSAKPAQLNAHAYAQGSDIHLAPGQDRHLPHEAWHLVQQAQGRVQPNLRLNGGVAVNDDPVLEREADQMGERALAAGD